MRDVFAAAREEALSLAGQGAHVEPEELRRLDHLARIALALFNRTDQITALQVAKAL